jgi:hypothetical protein
MRLFPYLYTAAGIRFVNRHEKQPACVYLHPWELDPDLLRLATGVVSRLRTYAGLRTMRSKLERLLAEFSFSTLTEVYPGPDAVRALVQRGPGTAESLRTN